MNRRALFLLLTACVLALVALGTRNGGLLALAIPFLAFLLVGLIYSPVAVDLQARRSVDKPSVVSGETVRSTLMVTNTADTLTNVAIRDRLPETAHVVDGSPIQTLVLANGETAELTYAFRADRGICSWQTLEAVAADPLFLFDRVLRIHAPGEVVVRPTPLGLPKLAFHPRRTLRSPGQIPVPLAGPGTDFLGVREYRPGDALRRINWRLAARHPGRLFTNEHERHEVGDFGLILDARQPSDAVFERAVSAAASLAESVLREGNRLSLLVFGRSMAATFPGYGKRQLSLVLRSLAAATRSAHIPLDYLDYFPERLFPNRAVLLMISTIAPSDQSMFARLRAAGFEVLLVSPDPIDSHEAGPRRDQAIRLARIERRATLLALSRLGVHVLDWPADQTIEAVLDRLSPRLVHQRNLAA